MVENQELELDFDFFEFCQTLEVDFDGSPSTELSFLSKVSNISEK